MKGLGLTGHLGGALYWGASIERGWSKYDDLEWLRWWHGFREGTHDLHFHYPRP